MKLLGRASAGLTLWAFGFTLLYALHGLGCAAGWSRVPLAGGTLFGWLMVTTWILLVAGAGAIVWWARTLPAGFERRLVLASALAGFAGILVTGSPVAVTSACL